VFKPKHAKAWLYWECSIAASRAKTPAERTAIWAHFTEPDPVMIPKIQCGYYRLRRGQKGARRYVPVAIWALGDRPDEVPLYALKIDGEMKPNASEFWERNAAFIEPVSYEDYQYAEEHGHWPGDVETGLPPLDHNALDQGALFRDQLVELATKIEAYITKEVGTSVADRVVADTLANYREMLGLAQKGAADTLKEELSQMKLAMAERKELWRPSIEAAKAAVERIRGLLTPWMQAQAAEGADVKIGGQRGRKMSMRPYWRARIDDWGMAVEHFADHPKVRAVVQELADAAARAKEKEPIEGIEFVNEGRAA
jgi:hypothetical protein